MNSQVQTFHLIATVLLPSYMKVANFNSPHAKCNALSRTRAYQSLRFFLCDDSSGHTRLKTYVSVKLLSLITCSREGGREQRMEV